MKIERVRLALLERGCRLNPPADSAAFDATEQRLGLKLPKVLRQLYQIFDGSFHETDALAWKFWPLQKLDFAEPDNHALRLLCFCDTMICLPAYGVRVYPGLDPQEVWCLIGENAYSCCASVERFLERLPGEMDDHLLDKDPPAKWQAS